MYYVLVTLSLKTEHNFTREVRGKMLQVHQALPLSFPFLLLGVLTEYLVMHRERRQ